MSNTNLSNFFYVSGTSMAAPHVAADVLGCTWESVDCRAEAPAELESFTGRFES